MPSQIHVVRRGNTVATVAAMLVGAIVLLFIGYSIGAGKADSGEQPLRIADAGKAPTPHQPAGTDPAPQGGANTDVRPNAGAANLGPTQPSAPRGTTTPLDPNRPAPFVFDPPRIDLGRIAPGAEAEAPFRIRNVSDKPFTILTMKTSCRCTSLEDLSGTVIRPGEEVELDVTLEGRTRLGPRAESVRFVFSGYGGAEIRIDGLVTRGVIADPSFIQAVEATAGTFTLESDDKGPFTVLAVNGRAPSFVGFDPETDAPRNQYTLSWDLSEYDAETCYNAEGERLPHFLVVETDHPACPIVDLFIRHMCTLPESEPGRSWIPIDHVMLGAVEPGQTLEATVAVVWPTERVPQWETIETVLSESPALTTEFIDIKPGRELQKDVRFRITISKDHRGLFYVPVRLYSSVHSAPVYVIGTVRE